MPNYLAAIFSDLEVHSEVWNRTPREKMVAIISEYRYLAESMASQYGSLHRNFMGDGHMFLFETADAAVQFGLKLIGAWESKSATSHALIGSPVMSLRLGCHFGECTQLEGGDAWIGRALNLAKRVEESAEPGSLYATENVLELVDLPLYEFEEKGSYSLKGDHLRSRVLYRLTASGESALNSKPPEQLSAETWLLEGVALIGTERENSDEEAEHYREALRIRAHYPEAHNNLAVLLRARGQLPEAEEHYREALAQRPEYPEAHYNYAVLLHIRGGGVASSEHFLRALELRDDYVDAHYGYGTLLKDTGDLVAAEQHYRDALRLRPDYADVHNNYAILLEEKGDYEGAEQHYSEALRIRPDYGETHYNFALLRDQQGDPSLAEAHYREAIQLRPNYPEALVNLAILLQAKGDFAEAGDQYQTVLGLRPDAPEVHYNYAVLLQAQGDQTGAEEHFRLAGELAQDEKEALP